MAAAASRTAFLLSSSALLLLLCFCTEAKEITVGGKSDAWTIPSSESDSLNKWAQRTRFRIGDSLLWKYDGTKDSVLEVSKKAYLACNVSEPIAGVQRRGHQGQKVIIVVLSPRTASPAPSPASEDEDQSQQVMSPAVAPTSAAAAASSFGFAARLVSVLGSPAASPLLHVLIPFGMMGDGFHCLPPE
ncbi:unnamed protein product [Linum tenue]|uniref:Phytocyanin domain-containing protein n=1 Tax=Linum tenue TaxID=586396 RepID=A0AAV0GVM9_9ROSI|nr:unnamed protein product [Linum tenue]